MFMKEESNEVLEPLRYQLFHFWKKKKKKSDNKQKKKNHTDIQMHTSTMQSEAVTDCISTVRWNNLQYYEWPNLYVNATGSYNSCLNKIVV